MAFIQFQNISKLYGDCISCQHIDLQIAEGTIHAVVGENGAGKSTLMNILGGLVAPTSGFMTLRGQPYGPRSPQDAFHQQIAFIHQHFELARQMTAFENILLSNSSNLHSSRKIPRAQIRVQTEALLKKFNWHIPLDQAVEKISVGAQQRLEILKALLLNPQIFIFDEPTAVLTPQEADELLNFLLQLKRDGQTVILISHKLNEIKKVADKITVMRAGKVILTNSASDFSIDQIAESMIGRKPQKSLHREFAAGEQVIFNLPATDHAVYKGEIFGVVGIEGNGQGELIQGLVNQCRRLKISFGDITEDRLPLSVFREASLIDHVILKHSKNLSRGGFIEKDKAKAMTEKLIQQWDVRPGIAQQALSRLSGGNQQKFIVGRELLHDPEIVIAAHPTRGVDLGAREMIHRALIDCSRKGRTVFLISSDLQEVLRLSNRFVILHRKNVYGPFKHHALTETEIGRYMAGNS